MTLIYIVNKNEDIIYDADAGYAGYLDLNDCFSQIKGLGSLQTIGMRLQKIVEESVEIAVNLFSDYIGKKINPQIFIFHSLNNGEVLNYVSGFTPYEKIIQIYLYKDFSINNKIDLITSLLHEFHHAYLSKILQMSTLQDCIATEAICNYMAEKMCKSKGAPYLNLEVNDNDIILQKRMFQQRYSTDVKLYFEYFPSYKYGYIGYRIGYLIAMKLNPSLKVNLIILHQEILSEYNKMKGSIINKSH